MFKLWKGSPQSKSKKIGAKDEKSVQNIDDDQPCNPFTEIQIFSHHSNIVRHLLRIDATRCVSAGDDGILVLWDVENGRRLFVLEGHSRPVTCCCVISPPDGDTIVVSAASDKHICLWNVDTGSLLRTLTVHNSIVRCLATLEDGTFCSAGEKLCRWSAEGHLLQEFNRPEEEDITQMVVIRENKIIGVVDKQLAVYTLEAREDGNTELQFCRKLPSHREAIKCLIKISDVCFASGSLDGAVILWSAHVLAPSRYFNNQGDYAGEDKTYPFSVQHLLSVQERYLVATVGSGYCVFDMISGKMIAEKTRAHYSKIINMEFVYEGYLLATCSEDGAIRLWGCYKSFCQDRQREGNGDSDGTLERFLGLSVEDLRLLRDKDERVEPHLLGECLGHSGAVQRILDLGAEGFLTCGVDKLVIAWKDGGLESMKRNALIQDFVKDYSGVS